jgi:hypothetical protein
VKGIARLITQIRKPAANVSTGRKINNQNK